MAPKDPSAPQVAKIALNPKGIPETALSTIRSKGSKTDRQSSATFFWPNRPWPWSGWFRWHQTWLGKLPVNGVFQLRIASKIRINGEFSPSVNGPFSMAKWKYWSKDYAPPKCQQKWAFFNHLQFGGWLLGFSHGSILRDEKLSVCYWKKKSSNTGESFSIMTLNGWKNCHDMSWQNPKVVFPRHDGSLAPSPGWILLCHGEVATTNIKTTTCGIFTYKIIRTTCVICTNIIFILI